MMKKCKKCGDDKPLEEFSFRSLEKGTKISHCKTCMRAQNKKHYENNKDVYMKRARNRSNTSRAWLVEYKNNACCAKCGFSHTGALQFHHLVPSEKDHEVGKMANDGYSIAKIQKEIDKCVVLCANCHFVLHYEERGG